MHIAPDSDRKFAKCPLLGSPISAPVGSSPIACAAGRRPPPPYIPAGRSASPHRLSTSSLSGRHQTKAKKSPTGDRRRRVVIKSMQLGPHSRAGPHITGGEEALLRTNQQVPGTAAKISLPLCHALPYCEFPWGTRFCLQSASSLSEYN